MCELAYVCASILACRPVHHTHMRERGHHEQADGECEPALDLLCHRLGERKGEEEEIQQVIQEDKS